MSDATSKLEATPSEGESPRAGLRASPGTPNRLVAWARGWSRRHLNREQLVGFFKNILWVAPLTVLIWIWAERQGNVDRPQVALPIEVVSNDPNKVLRIVNPSDKNLVLTLKGPRAALDRIVEQVNPASGSKPLQIVLNDTANEGTQTVDSLRVGEDKRLADAGITVVSASPRKIDIQVDPVIEVKVKVVPDVKLLEAPTFSPDIVTLRGPRSVLKPDQVGERKLEATAILAGRLPNETNAVTLSNVKLRSGFTDPAVTISPAEVKAVVQPDRPAQGTVSTVRVADISAPFTLLKEFDVQLPNDGLVYSVPVTGRAADIAELTAPNPARLPEAIVRLPRDTPAIAGDVEADLVFNFPKGVEVPPARQKLKVTLVRRPM